MIKKLYDKIMRLSSHRIFYKKNFDSKKFWQERYGKGGNSGAGSYGRLAEFKAEIINKFVKKNEIKSAIEFGCGDGNQLAMFKIPKYIGLDVSKKSIELCNNLFSNDKNKSFFLYDPQYFIDNLSVFKADLTLSLDVIYHLVEDEVFTKYMKDLFSTSRKYVIIYSSDTDKSNQIQSQHVRHRNFTKWVSLNLSGWSLVKKIDNKFPLRANEIDESFADFYIYEKK